MRMSYQNSISKKQLRQALVERKKKWVGGWYNSVDSALGLVLYEGFLFRIGFYVLREKCIFLFGVVLAYLYSLIDFHVSLGDRFPSLKSYQFSQFISFFLNITNYILNHIIFFLGLSSAIDSISLFR